MLYFILLYKTDPTKRPRTWAGGRPIGIVMSGWGMDDDLFNYTFPPVNTTAPSTIMPQEVQIAICPTSVVGETESPGHVTKIVMDEVFDLRPFLVLRN
jgi:hypothetical protein